LRAYVGKPTDQEIVNLSDEEITDIVLQDLNKIMEISGQPQFTVVTRWKRMMPQYTVGHQKRIATVQKGVHEHLPGVFLAGRSYEGVGVHDCFGQIDPLDRDVLAF